MANERMIWKVLRNHLEVGRLIWTRK